MQVFDLAVIRKLIVQILLARLLMHVRDNDDPAFDGADSGRVGVRLHGRLLAVSFRGLRFRVDVHLVGHDGFVLLARKLRGVWWEVLRLGCFDRLDLAHEMLHQSMAHHVNNMLNHD